MGLQDFSETQQGSSDVARGRANKADKGEKNTRRSWSPREEVVLIASLKELVANGWKSDNGFKPRYLLKLQEALVKEFPGTNLKATPHINSKLQTWKKNYYSLSLMLSHTGVGFTGAHVIDATPEQWDSMIKQDANVKSMRHKSWPMYEEWKEVFGKDRATGEGAENADNVMDEVNKLMQQESQKEHGEAEGDYHPSFEDISVNDVGDDSASHAETQEAVHKKASKGKKRKASESVGESVTDVLHEMMCGTNSRLDTIASRIGYEFDLDQAKKMHSNG